jgi:hypothetical protein
MLPQLSLGRLLSPTLRAARRSVNVRSRPFTNHFSEFLSGVVRIAQGEFRGFSSKLEAVTFERWLGVNNSASTLSELSRSLDLGAIHRTAVTAPVESLLAVSSIVRAIAQQLDTTTLDGPAFTSLKGQITEVDSETEIWLVLLFASLIQNKGGIADAKP